MSLPSTINPHPSTDNTPLTSHTLASIVEHAMIGEKVLLSESLTPAEHPPGGREGVGCLPSQARKNLEISKIDAYRALVSQYRQDLEFWVKVHGNEYAVRRIKELDQRRNEIEAL